MTGEARPLRELMMERTRIVLEVSQLNAAHLRAAQFAGGIEIELLTARRELEADPSSAAARQVLDDARSREMQIHADLARCEAQLAVLDLRLDELDRELARA